MLPIWNIRFIIVLLQSFPLEIVLLLLEQGITFHPALGMHPTAPPTPPTEPPVRYQTTRLTPIPEDRLENQNSLTNRHTCLNPRIARRCVFLVYNSHFMNAGNKIPLSGLPITQSFLYILRPSCPYGLLSPNRGASDDTIFHALIPHNRTLAAASAAPQN